MWGFIKMSRPEITKHKTDRYRKEYELSNAVARLQYATRTSKRRRN
jgi:hypothetical protein